MVPGGPQQAQPFQSSPAGAGYGSPQAQPDQQAAVAAAWAQYYQQQNQLGAVAPAGGASPAHSQAAVAVPAQSQEEAAKIAAAWQAYYAAQAQYAQQMAAQGWSQAQIQQAQAHAAGQVQGAGQPSHQGSGEGYAPERAEDASARSLSGPDAPQGYENSREQAPYAHQSGGSLSMPQPQVYGQPINQANQSQTSLLTPSAPSGQNAAFLPTQGQPIKMSASPQPMPQAPSSFPSAPQEEHAPLLQHNHSSGNFAQAGQTGQAWQPSAPGQGMLPSSPQQSPRIEHNQVGQRQSQTGLETAVAQMAFQ